VDVGGGQGILLVEILRRHHHLEGVLFDLPATAARANAVLDGSDLADRCHVEAGDFFTRVPEGADCYILANVLHDWNDTQATLILHNCRGAMARHGKVLIVERRIPECDNDAIPALLSDINMLVITGGRERTDTEYSELLNAAGLRLGGIAPAAFPYCVIEGILA
jgi:O-methyltransferase domain